MILHHDFTTQGDHKGEEQEEETEMLSVPHCMLLSGDVGHLSDITSAALTDPTQPEDLSTCTHIYLKTKLGFVTGFGLAHM